MNGLYPIIRRVRRPLVVEEQKPTAPVPVAPMVEAAVAPVAAVSPVVEPPATPMGSAVEPVQPVKLPETSDAKVSTKRKGR